MHSVANSNSKLIREIRQLIHCQIKIFHRILKGEAVHFMHFLSPPASIRLTFHSFFTSFIGRIQSHSFAYSVFPHYPPWLIHLPAALCFTHWIETKNQKPKTKMAVCVYFSHSFRWQQGKWICVYVRCVCSWLYCMFHENGRAMQLATESEWVANQPTQNQIQKSDFLYAAGICTVCNKHICIFVVEYLNETKRNETEISVHFYSLPLDCAPHCDFPVNFPLCFKKRVKMNGKCGR